MVPVQVQQPGMERPAAENLPADAVLSADTPPTHIRKQPAALARAVIPFFVGGLLLIAAGLKSYSLLAEPVSGPLWQPLALVAVEVFFGLALLLGLWPQQIRWGALAMFAAFLSFSLGKAFSGASSCGCLGKIDLSPWAAAFVDVAALLALWLWRPICNRPSLERLRFSFAISVPLVLVAGLTWAGSRMPFPRLEVTPALIELGTVTQGSRTELAFLLRNPHDRPVLINSIEISCHCLRAKQSSLSVLPGQEEKVRLVLTRESDLSSGMLIEVRGRAAPFGTAFFAGVRVD